MFYQTISGEIRARSRIDIGSFGDADVQILNWLLLEFSTARSWIEFQQRTAHGVIEHAKKVSGINWQNHPLYAVQLDLVGRAGIMSGKMHGELSDMLVVPEALSGSWFKNGDIELVLTTGEWRVLTTPYEVFGSDAKYQFFTSSEGVLVGINGSPSAKSALLRIDDSLKSVPDEVQVVVRENEYRVGVTKNSAERALNDRVLYARFGNSFRFTLRVD